MKTDGDLGNPSVYVPLDTRTVDRNVRPLEDCFGTQRDKRWFSKDAFRGLRRPLGIEACPPGGFAEAFYGRRIIICPCMR
jgi:hypothetical protein